ncbi:MAG: DUF1405 domain-containing protein [Methanosarcinales archaeon]
MNHIKWILDFFAFFKKNKNARIVVLIMVLIGSIYGYYYYYEQLISTSIYFWIFIPDCPLFTTIYFLVLLLYIRGIQDDRLDIFTIIGLLKYGIWTMFVILLYSDYYLQPESITFEILLFSMHFGMPLLAFTLLQDIKKIKVKEFLAITAIFFIFDIFDYFLDTHPIIPLDKIEVVMYFTFLESIWIPMLVWFYLKPIFRIFKNPIFYK